MTNPKNELAQLIEQTKTFLLQAKEDEKLFVHAEFSGLATPSKTAPVKSSSPSIGITEQTKELPKPKEMREEKKTDKKSFELSLEPIANVQTMNFNEIESLVKTLRPETKKRTSFFLLAFSEEDFIFYSKIAQALIQMKFSSEVIRITSPQDWNKILKEVSGCCFLVAVKQLKDYFPSESSKFITHELISLLKFKWIPLAETTDYAKTIQLKHELWNLLKSQDHDLF